MAELDETKGEPPAAPSGTPADPVQAKKKKDQKTTVIIILTAVGVVIAFLTLRKSSSSASNQATTAASGSTNPTTYPSTGNGDVAGYSNSDAQYGLFTYLQNLQSEVTALQTAQASGTTGSTVPTSGTSGTVAPGGNWAWAKQSVIAQPGNPRSAVTVSTNPSLLRPLAIRA